MENTLVQFNVNDHVLVKLLDDGIIAFIKHYNQYALKKEDKLTITEFVKRADKDGYYEIQMHEFMSVFGEHVSNTMDFRYFEPNIYFNKKDLHQKEVKAVEGWSAQNYHGFQVDLPDGYYEGVWGGGEVDIINLNIKGRESTYTFKTSVEVKCTNCPVKVTVVNKRAYVYEP